LSVLPAHITALLELPLLHRDPFDRLLIAQARSEGMVLSTADAEIRKYPIPTLA
jgi:PIN domain nuclease of toxin-antitoxin system